MFGYELLREALSTKKGDVVAIVTLSDKAKTKMYDGIEKSKWYGFGLPVYETENINEEISLLRSLRPDVIIMCGWRQILSKDVLNLPPQGVIAFHPTLLPKGRGPAPIINTILEGFKQGGVTMYYASESVDGGDIVGQESFEVEEDDYAMDVYNKVIEAGRTLIKKYLPLLMGGKASRIPQNEAEATYLKKRTLEDNEIKLGTESPEEIYRKIRAFSKPYKGAFVRLGNKKLVIWKAELRKTDEE